MKKPMGSDVKSGNTIRRCRGESLVEFALVAPLFFLLVFGITDFGRLFFLQQTLQFAVREAGRYAVTGQHNGTNRVASIQEVIQNASQGITIGSIDIRSVNSAGVTNIGSAGGPRDTVVITLTTGIKLITPMIGRFFGTSQTYTSKVSVSFMNEPFDPSQTN